MTTRAAAKEIRKLEKRILRFQGRAARASVADVKMAKRKVTALARKLGYRTASHLVSVLFGDSHPRRTPAKAKRPAKGSRGPSRPSARRKPSRRKA